MRCLQCLCPYLQNLTYDGSHVLLITSKEEAQTYYAYLKNNVFNGTPEFRTLTLFFSGKNSTLSVGNWRTIYESDLVAFLDSLGIPCRYDYSTAAARTGADVMVMVAFGK